MIAGAEGRVLIIPDLALLIPEANQSLCELIIIAIGAGEVLGDIKTYDSKFRTNWIQSQVEDGIDFIVLNLQEHNVLLIPRVELNELTEDDMDATLPQFVLNVASYSIISPGLVPIRIGSVLGINRLVESNFEIAFQSQAIDEELT